MPHELRSSRSRLTAPLASAVRIRNRPPSAILTIASKDVRIYFCSPIAYLVAMTFMLTTGVAFLWDLGDHGKWPVASLESFFLGDLREGNVFSAAMVLIPLSQLLTMRLLAEEQRLGTIELLLTAPVRDWQVIVGKYIASCTLQTLPASDYG